MVTAPNTQWYVQQNRALVRVRAQIIICYYETLLNWVKLHTIRYGIPPATWESVDAACNEINKIPNEIK